MNKLVYCYHCHTKRCGHATGEDEEYVKAAIKLGIKRLGFSDHIMLPGYSQPGVRGDFCEIEGYLNSIHSLREKYKDQIEILVGFEAEYIEELVEYYKEILDTKVIDYLIMGQHSTGREGKIIGYFHRDSSIEDVRRYVDDVIVGIKTGLFKYVAHPDLYMLFQSEWNDELEEQGRRILKACEEYNTPIEINIWGLKRNSLDGYSYSYPNEHFFELIKDNNIKVVIGMDAHNPEFFSQENVDAAFEFAKRHNINIDLDFHL